MTDRRPRRAALGRSGRATALVLALGGCALGFGMRAPGLAWLGLALTAFGLARETSGFSRAGGLLAASSLSMLLRLYFLWDGFCAFMPPAQARRYAVGIALAAALVDRAPAALVALCWRRSTACVPLWLPPAWLAGERLFALGTGLPLDAWMLTQARTVPLLHVLAWVGYFPAAWLALALGSYVGSALADSGGARPRALAVCGLVAALACAVPARRHGVEVLRGVVALRLDRALGQLAPDPNARIVVWPETASPRALELAREGPLAGVRVPPPARSPSSAEHLVGFFNRPDGRVENGALVVAPDGEARWYRAKRALFPLAEAPWLGHMLPNAREFTPGSIDPVTRIAGRRAGVLICLELFDRAMVERATPPGVELLLVPAGDSVVGLSSAGHELMVAVSVLTAAERGVAVARASWRGVALLVAPDGAVVARSDSGHLRNASLAGSP